MWMRKAEIIRLGHQLGVPLSNTWSCYKGEEYQCGICPTCRSRIDGFAKAGVTDYTVYNQDAAEMQAAADFNDDGIPL